MFSPNESDVRVGRFGVDVGLLGIVAGGAGLDLSLRFV